MSTDSPYEEPQGGRVFFSSIGRSLEGEDEIRLTSVGVDIGSSTSHLVFSRLLLERLDNRYVVTDREVFHESDVLLTPYAADTTIDADVLGAFVEAQYADADVKPDEIDTGALILTGVAVRRSNARAIGELFASQAGKFVSVSAGDGLETILAAFGSGAALRSIRDKASVMNIDIGGGTSKIALCVNGDVPEITAVDVGARVIAMDNERRVVRIEEAGKRFAAEQKCFAQIRHGLELWGETPLPAWTSLKLFISAWGFRERNLQTWLRWCWMPSQTVWSRATR